jgi:hypothetical protein
MSLLILKNEDLNKEVKVLDDGTILRNDVLPPEEMSLKEAIHWLREPKIEPKQSITHLE